MAIGSLGLFSYDDEDLQIRNHQKNKLTTYARIMVIETNVGHVCRLSKGINLGIYSSMSNPN